MRTLGNMEDLRRSSASSMVPGPVVWGTHTHEQEQSCRSGRLQGGMVYSYSPEWCSAIAHLIVDMGPPAHRQVALSPRRTLHTRDRYKRPT